ncbi:MAG: ABC transporter ATP-binding protein [Verrucomicrobiales bacterium]|jgi:ABC-2 type transport system ATP-binding protein|nr:ABC transporter ATP-binding protein [Verrucomicrobiales bacterium]
MIFKKNWKKDWAVCANELSKLYPVDWTQKRLHALDRLDLYVRRGEVFGLLGPNGSGKSTTLKLILGLLNPSSGSVQVFGAEAGTLEARRRIGFLPENAYFPAFLSGREVLRYYGRLVDLAQRKLWKRVEELLELVELTAAAARPLKTYSKGMLQRIGLAQALLNDPDLLLLDEPTAGVDPIGARQIRDLILGLRARGKTVIFSSHLLEQVQEVADRVAILHRGTVIQEGTLEDLLSVREQTQFTVSGLAPVARERLEEWLRGEGAEVLEVTHPRERLEELFIKAVEKRR